MAREKKGNRAASAYFESYAEYNRILRSWFVAFGIGGLAMFLVEDKLRDALIGSGAARLVIALFLAGVALQILVAGMNKYANWYCYAGEDDAAYRRTAAYRFWSGIARQFIIDVVVDLATAFSFFAAIGILFSVFSR
jgi:hypothetical protein